MRQYGDTCVFSLSLQSLIKRPLQRRGMDVTELGLVIRRDSRGLIDYERFFTHPCPGNRKGRRNPVAETP